METLARIFEVVHRVLFARQGYTNSRNCFLSSITSVGGDFSLKLNIFKALIVIRVLSLLFFFSVSGFAAVPKLSFNKAGSTRNCFSFLGRR